MAKTISAKTRAQSKKKEVERSGFSFDSQSFSFTNYLDTIDKEHIQHLLRELWNCWQHVLDEEIAAYALPLGHIKHELLIGCADSVEAQELRMNQSEILNRVNAFLGRKFFTSLRVELMLNRHDLKPLGSRKKAATQSLPVSEAHGNALAAMDLSSPVARCYQTFLRSKTASSSGPAPQAEHAQSDC